MLLPERIDTVYAYAEKVDRYWQETESPLPGGCLLLACAATIPAGYFNGETSFEEFTRMVVDRRKNGEKKELSFFIEFLSGGHCRLIGPWEIGENRKELGAEIIEEATVNPDEALDSMIDEEERPECMRKKVSGLLIMQTWPNRKIGHIFAILPDYLVFDTPEEHRTDDGKLVHLFVDTAWKEHGPFKDGVNFLTSELCLEYAFSCSKWGTPELLFFFVLADK